jgi:hypothetical protein
MKEAKEISNIFYQSDLLIFINTIFFLPHTFPPASKAS